MEPLRTAQMVFGDNSNCPLNLRSKNGELDVCDTNGSIILTLSVEPDAFVAKVSRGVRVVNA